MSDSNSTDASGHADAGSRLDALLSAERDGELEADERAELESLLQDDPAATARRAAFAAVDEALIALGSVPLDDEAIAEGLEAVRTRTVAGASTDSPGVVQVDPRRSPWRHPIVRILAGAVAAALILYFAMAPTDPADGPGSASAPRVAQTSEAADPDDADAPMSEARTDGGVAASTSEVIASVGTDEVFVLDDSVGTDEVLGLDPELALALGYGEGTDLVPGVEDDDLAVISELDLLDFMAAREEEGRG